MNIVDLQTERELNELTHKLGKIINRDPACVVRTQSFLYGDELMKNEESCLLSVRIPKTLADGIDDLAREIAFKEKRKVTRSTLVNDWLTSMMKAEQLRKEQQQ
jgi:hypothetical protein